MSKSRCPACFSHGDLQCHHIFPKRWFDDNPPYKFLCSRCHAQLERLIESEEKKSTGFRVKLPMREYSEMLEVFLAWKNEQVFILKAQQLAHRAAKAEHRGDRYRQLDRRSNYYQRRRAV